MFPLQVGIIIKTNNQSLTRNKYTNPIFLELDMIHDPRSIDPLILPSHLFRPSHEI